MAITGKFSYTNNELTGEAIQPVVVDPLSNYALIEDEPNRCVMQNRTGEVDQIERLIYQKGDVKNVPLSFPNPNASSTAANTQYGIKLESLYRKSSSTDDTYIVDDAVTVALTIKHPNDKAITPDVVYTVIQRLLGSLYGPDKSIESIKSRLDDLRRGALKPTK